MCMSKKPPTNLARSKPEMENHAPETHLRKCGLLTEWTRRRIKWEMKVAGSMTRISPVQLENWVRVELRFTATPSTAAP